MYTSIVLVALAGSSISAAVPVSLDFRSDYVTARKMGKSDRKPLAVFIGSGPKGWEQRTTDGQLSQDVQQLLQAHYVCVYVDTATDDGKRLARDFAMDEGLVLSDAQGENQAFRYASKLSNSDLERQLKKYSDPARVVVHTDTQLREDVRYYPAEAAPAAPAYYPAPYIIQSSGYCPSCSRR
jgi:hypothetical protein